MKLGKEQKVDQNNEKLPLQYLFR